MPHPEIEQNFQELIFSVEDLPEQEPQNFEGKLGINQCPRLLELVEDSGLDVEYQFSLKRDSRKVLIDGQFKGQFKLNCDRCLGTVAYQPEESFSIRLQPSEDHPRPAEETLLTLEELEWDVYDQSSLNLAELIEEQVLISIPEKKLCSTSCKGLCQRCGVNLNKQSCLCTEEIEDHPFAVLKGIGSEWCLGWAPNLSKNSLKARMDFC